MINHLTINTLDFNRAKAFYGAALAPIGYTQAFEHPGSVCFADASDADSVWVSTAKQGATPTPVHIAFTAADEASVQAFYDAALKAGATDNGKPGPRPDYGPNYYAAFVHDPEGNNIEAVHNA
ncbi:VOC family protein [Thermophilibacter immobilis]|uniref:VOC family protein n=1 Tax=Thermophilibacter immobilis TaxID=2779519 RepID=A0A7S7RUQ2_9ACTN|nr:VOC family protein [Thermophilibacter immobilis]QOY60813.1 VOC family protein [Thermophilibacter immobilis]